MAQLGTRLDPSTLVFGLRVAADPRLSPDGATIVYALGAADREADRVLTRLVLLATEGGEPRPLTGEGHQDVGPAWSPDGGRIAFVSDRAEKNGVFVVPAAGGEPRELARHPGPIGNDLQWSPDGRRLAYTAQVDPDGMAAPAPVVRVTRRTDYKQDVRGYLGEARKQVFVLDAETGERRQLTDGAHDHDFPRWSPDGRLLAARRVTDILSGRLALIDAAGGQTTLAGPEAGSLGLWAWSPDGGRLLLAADPRLSAQFDLYLHEVRSGELRRLTEDLQVQPDPGYPNSQPPSPPVWLDERRVVLHALRGGASGLYRFDVETAELEPLASWQAVHLGLSADARARRFVQVRTGFREAGELSLVDLDARTASVPTRHNAGLLESAALPEAERFEVRREAFAIEAWLLKPPGFDPSRLHPLVLDVHGGPHGHHGPAFNHVQQVLAAAGFLVVLANPRGSASYGRHFAVQVQRHWGEEDYLDLMAAVDAVLARGFADPGRTGIYGYSYGGYMTSWVIGQTDRFRAAVCGAPCFDLASMYGTSDITPAWGGVQWGGRPHELPDWYRDHSPSTHAHRARTPTLIIHGEADHRCPIGQGEEMFVQLSQAGCEVEFARYPGASHLFMRVGRPSQRQDCLERITGWFRTHLGGQAEG